ncbi:helix-turn-helix domain-containing protein [Halobium salinum]|uniref:Helix-turn-helix domain-containing protein n=1 Tax=Halobium salinum TaxID=1364940 RepID=A0ABD5P9U1_9EURY|nr:helix-turn-helix domain-containing protein [Halobium salinum]
MDEGAGNRDDRDVHETDRRMREVVLLVRHHGEPESDVSAAYPNVTLRSRSSMTGRDGRRKRIVEVTGDEAEIPAFLDAFEAAESILEVEPLTEPGRPRVYVAVTVDATRWDSISERLSELGVHYRNGTTISAGWERWTLYLRPDESTATVRESLEAAGNETELVRDVGLGSVDAGGRLDALDLRERLTDRQREVLLLAVDRGFYGPDRTVSLDEIGAELGVTKTTAWEHLQRAEGKVMEALEGALRETPESEQNRESESTLSPESEREADASSESETEN